MPVTYGRLVQFTILSYKEKMKGQGFGLDKNTMAGFSHASSPDLLGWLNAQYRTCSHLHA